MTTSNKHNWINNYQKCSICGVEFIEWVEIPGGTFMMGSPTNEKDRNEDEVQHKVTIRSFRMSKYAVTASQYSLFTKVKGIKNHGYGKGQEPIEIDDYHFADILAFADWMGCRLPTEAEWEYACRAGSTTPFNTGNILLTSMANFGGENPYANRSYNEDPLGYESRLSSTCVKSVGCYPPNAWGLYDMHGNVYEWCSDWYGDYVIEDQVNPQGPPTGEFHVCRGGSHWPYSSRCRSAARHNFANKSYDGGIPIGFRLVLEI
jgi:formylglycine-generating enzyme required for sulfatase activity